MASILRDVNNEIVYDSNGDIIYTSSSTESAHITGTSTVTASPIIILPSTINALNQFEKYNNYISYMKNGIYKPSVKIQWLRKDESVESEVISDLTDFSITKNINNGVRKSADIQLKNINEEYIPSLDGIWIGKKIRVFSGYEDYLFSQGVFVISNPSISSNPSSSNVNINCADKASLYNGQNGGVLTDIYLINVGANFNTAIKSTMLDAGELKTPILQNTTLVTPYTIKTNRGDTYWDIVGNLATAMGRDCFFDDDGYLKVRQMRIDNVKPSVWDFNYSDDNFTYLSSNSEYDFEKVYNAYQVFGDNIDGIQVSGYAENNDTSSSTCIQKIGYRLAPPIEDSTIQTDEQAQTLAEYKLKRSIRLNQSIDINCIYLPHIKEDDVITITDDNLGLVKERFVVNRINATILGSKCSMTINATRFTDVEIVVG